MLAEGIASVAGISDLDPTRVRTDFVIFRVPDRTAFLDAIEREGVLMVPWGSHEVRAVTHYGVGRADVARAIDVVAAVMRRASAVAVPS
jgi:threonine aldolase